jgi:hypothetical protein
VAVFVAPVFVRHVSTNDELAVSAGDFTAPETLVELAFSVVNAGSVGLEIVHASIPLVTQPMFACAPLATLFGYATSVIPVRFTFTVHCALWTMPWFEQFNPYVTVFPPRGGGVMVVVAEPESAPPVENPVPPLTAEFWHAKEIETCMPMSAICG